MSKLLPKLLITLPFLIGSLFAGWRVSPDPSADLYAQFRNPPNHDAVMPYWYWNGKITAQETRRQIRSMVGQGVRAAIVFPWDGMEVPYLSEQWWQALGDALDAASEAGFTLNLNDEFTWPSGHAWDHFQQGPELSRVLKANPEYRMKRLTPEEFSLPASGRWNRSFAQTPEVVVVGRLNDASNLEADSLQIIPVADNKVSWQVPNGQWKAFVYSAREVTGAHNTRVDLLNKDAVRKYIEIFYEELARRFPQHLGKTLKLTTADHEGTYGVNPVWTPALWESFRQGRGYDLRKFLPLLHHNGDGRAQKIRADYFATVSEMYRASFLEQITRWCEARGVKHTASFYEEQMAIQVRQAGDMFGLWRTMSLVEIDALLERARMPIDFQEAVSVAHFEKKRLVVENQGLQGNSSFLSPEKMRLGTNMALLWGADVLVPYFDYDPRKIQWPPQWFESQPFWPYFHNYADYARRVSFMNSRGTHVAPIALYYPLESAYANSQPLFEAAPRNELQWGNEMDDTQAYYSALQLQLSRRGWAYHIFDAHYLEKAAIDDARLKLAGEEFRVMILPPLTSIKRAAMRKLCDFYDRGGKVLAIGRLPNSSPEAGENDPEIIRLIQGLFGEDAYRQQAGIRNAKSANGGEAIFFPAGRHPNFMNVLDYMRQTAVPAEYVRALEPLFEAIGRIFPREAEVIQGESDGVYVSHRFEGENHFYWVVNDSERERSLRLLVGSHGVAQNWDPLTGERSLLVSRRSDRGTEVELTLEPWGGTYVMITPTTSGLTAPRKFGTLDTISLMNGDWRFAPDSAEILAPYASVRTGKIAEGEKAGWQTIPSEPITWKDEWLSVENLANPSWWMIGPFPYGDHQGYNEAFPPEKEIDLAKAYQGENGKEVRWSYSTSATYWVNAREALRIPRPANSVAYAFSYVYSPVERDAQIRVAFADSVKVWWNDEQELAVHRHPKWMSLSDPWSERVDVKIKKGWNKVLLKVCRSENRPISFMFRIADPAGNTLKDLDYARSTDSPRQAQQPDGEKWYRLESPPGARAFLVPAFERLRKVFINGREVKATAGARIALPESARATIAFVCAAGERLERPIHFVSGPTDLKPGTWTQTALANYSGAATYETQFSAPSLQPEDRFQLDLGEVGVVAEVWVNGIKSGERVWRPYSFDITKQIRPGANTLKIRIANSDANWQAQGDPIYPFGSWGMRIRSERERLAAVQQNGLIGPVIIKIQR
jgi:hypothetical protein